MIEYYGWKQSVKTIEKKIEFCEIIKRRLMRIDLG
jgi:hypothetical protein